MGTEQNDLTTPMQPSRGSQLWKPHAYQRKAIKFLIERGAAGLWLEPGLGKTSVTLAALSLLLEQQLTRGALVIAPLRPVYLVWPDELRKWREFTHLKFEILHGSDKDRALKRKADVYLINPEGLRWLFRVLGPDHSRWPFDILVIDESSKFKNTRTERFKNLRDQLPRFRRRYTLTGTPAPNGLLDLFGQIYCLDLGRSLGRYVTHYRMEFFQQTGFGGYDWVLRPGSEQEIYARIAPLVLRMDEKDYLEMPPLVEANHFVELPKDARRVYDEVESKFLTELDSGSITVQSAATATIKLQQIANGGAYLDSQPGRHRAAAHLHDAKTECLLDLLEELEGQPTLVAYAFEHDLQRLRPALKKAGFGDVPHLGGGVSPRDAQSIVDRWNDGQLPVLLGHPQSVAHGLNLQKAGRAVIWYALTWDLELYEQFVRRVYRQGQTGRVIVHRILARKTVDEAILGALQRKTRGQRALLDALRAYYLPSTVIKR